MKRSEGGYIDWVTALVTRRQRGTGPAAAFLHDLTQKHDYSQALFLVDGFGYLTAFSQVCLSSRLNYTDPSLSK